MFHVNLINVHERDQSFKSLIATKSCF